jgi:hypothetical protein
VRTYPSACKHIECVHLVFVNTSSCTTLMHATPKPGVNGSPTYMYITFTLGTNDSPAYMYNYKGLWIRDITIPSPLFMHCPQCIIYTCTYKISNIIKNMRILCSHSILALQVASSGPYQVHWTFTNSMTRFQSCLIFRSNMKTDRT